MYTLIVTITMFGWFSDEVHTITIDGFRNPNVCLVAGEQLKDENTKKFVSKAKYSCVRK
ncbi:hypothetical protein ZZ1p0225 [Acinetobacter phage ZZ1]|jgi:hypothetical protein|uniref:Uncharacterized protein n=2 Tax=Caudoviricetes TaxID=2731619 RepID=I3WW27_9CAUD|nr:hypothetical protein ZZ1p0225 [Acinetobacter phage ZZ1]AFL47697.1 hypothetical protein ZZ1p0225 [Acinetobacter phage ZZ1]